MTPKLIIYSPDGQRSEFPLDKPVTTLGRDDDSDLVLKYPHVSRHHARFERGDDGCTVVDCASTNGTYVNGARLEAPRALLSGDAVSIGDLSFTYVDPDAAAEMTLQLSPASGTPPEGAFKTILFTDVEGSTSLIERFGDAAARDLFREVEAITRQALTAHGGHEIKTMGDGFMASFDSATRALACAVAIQRALDERNAAALQLRVRMGLNAGEPIAERGDLHGAAVVTAARIAAQAAGGEVLVTDLIRQLVAGKGYVFADRGEFVPRGLAEPVRVWQLKW